MKPLKFLFSSVILLFVMSLQAQEWSQRITIIEKHLIASTNTQIDALQIDYLLDGGDVAILHSGDFSAGFNMLFEETIDKGFLVKDLFVYNVGLSYSLGKFNMSFMFENFLNLTQREADILPDADYAYGVVQNITYTQDSPFMATLGIRLTF